MNIKKESGLAGIDTIIAVIAVILFSTLIIFLITNNILENLKLAKESMAIIYITEIFENIAIEEYVNVTQENSNNFIPTDIKSDYQVEINVTDYGEEDIMKKINVKLTYGVGNKEYTCSMERFKTKE